jgi:hypothetical protein
MKLDRRRDVGVATELKFMLGSPSPLDTDVSRLVIEEILYF